MQYADIASLCQRELSRGTSWIHTGVSGRLLNQDDAYPEIVTDYDSRLMERAKELSETLHTADPSKLRQQLLFLKDAAITLEQGRDWKHLISNLQDLLPYNLQGIKTVMDPEILYKEIVSTSIALTTQLILTQYQPSKEISPEHVVATGRALIRLVYDIRTVVGEILLKPVHEDTELTDQSLADVIRSNNTQEQLLRVFRGDGLITPAIEDDIAVLCGAAVRPLHLLIEFAPYMRQPGSLVWSNAALYQFVNVTSFQRDATPALISFILKEKNESGTPTDLADPSVIQLFVLGIESLREYYAKHPPQKPACEVDLPTDTSQNATKSMQGATAATNTTSEPVANETLLELAQEPSASTQIPINGRMGAVEPISTEVQPPVDMPPAQPTSVTPVEPAQPIPVDKQTSKIKPINLS